MSKLLRGGKIADPIHSYVDITWVEHALLDHPLCQRLQYISQNGLLYLVYPSVRTSRFAHSLGAMHLASKAFASSIMNTDSSVRNALVNTIKEAIEETAGGTKNLQAADRTLSPEGLLAWHYAPNNKKPYLLIAEQALRLAALFHDLGHLPYSHDFERGLEIFLKSKPDKEINRLGLSQLRSQGRGRVEIHEQLGHCLSSLVFNDVFTKSAFDSKANETARLCFNFAQKILDAPENPPVNADQKSERALYWLHSLIAGEIDVDRCDYILRDGRNLGFDFADYDLTRLLDNLIVVEDRGAFVTAVKPQGLSAVESFLLARLLSYRYAIFHHKVAQIGVALRQSIVNVLSNNKGAEVFLTDLGKVLSKAKVPKNIVNRFAGYDDVWWMGILRSHFYFADKNDEWIRLVCRRERGITSLWKRIDEFPTQDIKPWNEQLLKRSDPAIAKRWADTVEALEKDGVFVETHRFNPLKEDHELDESALKIRLNDGKLRPASDISPMLKSLRDIWMNEVQVRAFCKSKCKLSREDVFKRLDKSLRNGELQ